MRGEDPCQSELIRRCVILLGDGLELVDELEVLREVRLGEAGEAEADVVRWEVGGGAISSSESISK